MKIASKYCRDRGILRHLDDVREAAWFGLVDAAWLFDPRRGVPFTSYLYTRVMGQIVEHFRQRSINSKAHAACVSLESGVDSENQHSGERFGYWPNDAERLEDGSEVSRLLSRFTAPEQFAYKMYHGHDYSMRQVGHMIGVSESRVSQMLSSMQKRLEASHAD